jgi:murein DD-endopeptidase MepM/ murein hydrolase activator NlpD
MITYRQPFVGSYPITQYYGEVVPGVTFAGKPHTGIDYACPIGTEILASADGTIVWVGYAATGYGNWIVMKHPDGKATLYAHLDKAAVKIGQQVKQGDVIGYSGYSGNVVPAGPAGAHLHFEARRNWFDTESHEDPITFLPMMSYVDQGSGSEDQGEEEIVNNNIEPGVYLVACKAAYVRDWNTLARLKLVYEGAPVYVFRTYKYLDGLKFYYTGAGCCMAAVDKEGTIILEKDNGEE